MRKITAIILALVMVFCLCSCGSKDAVQETPAPAASQTTETPAATTPAAPASTETPAIPEEQETVKATDADADAVKDVYRAFLAGNQKLAVAKDCDCFLAGESYLLPEFRDTFLDYESEEWGIDNNCTIYYSYLDCGSDGIPELALEFEVFDEENYNTYYHYFVINCVDSTPSLIGGYEYYYRSYSYINEAGVVECGGSSGAGSYYYDYTWINGDGEEVFIYSSSTEMANPKPAIPSYFLPKEIPDDYYDMFAYDVDEYYTVHAYSFEDFDKAWDDSDYDTAYDAFCHSYFFTITDDEGNDVDPAEEYAAIYKENNVKIVSMEEAGNMIQTHMEELGVTDEIFNAPYLSYEVLDLEQVNDEVIVNDDGSITVGCAANLMANIADGATIYLKPGVYNMSEWMALHANIYEDYNDGTTRCRTYPYSSPWNSHIFFAGSQVLVNRINDLTIASLDPDDPAEIVIDDMFSQVMIFSECSDLSLLNIVAGHTPGNEGHCSADVFEFNACDRVYLENCDLYGCGCYGICGKDLGGLTVNGGRIHDCTSGMVELYGCYSVEFDSVKFENCKTDWGYMFTLYDTSVDFYSCSFKNLGNMFDLDSSYVWISASTMDAAAEKSTKDHPLYDHNIYMY